MTLPEEEEEEEEEEEDVEEEGVEEEGAEKEEEEGAEIPFGIKLVRKYTLGCPFTIVGPL